MSDDWEAQRVDSEERWDSTFDSEDPLLSVLSDKDILGVCDGYDDWKLDTVFQAYVDLRKEVKKLRQRCIDEGIVSEDMWLTA